MKYKALLIVSILSIILVGASTVLAAQKKSETPNVGKNLKENKKVVIAPKPSVSPSPKIFPSPKTSPLPSISSTPKPSAQPLPSTSPSSSFAPKAQVVTYFSTLGVGSSLPSDNTCASLVRKTPEIRAENSVANSTVATGGPYIADVYKGERITGNFTGTTDEIIQWASCKWGFDENIVRAVAGQESWWRMSEVGDNGQSFGLMQVKRTVHTYTYPASVNSTAFNLDYALSYRRACFEGQHSWMKDKGYSNYASGDEWGCVGSWFSGNWYDGDINTPYSGANWYIKEVKNHLANKTWTQSNF